MALLERKAYSGPVRLTVRFLVDDPANSEAGDACGLLRARTLDADNRRKRMSGEARPQYILGMVPTQECAYSCANTEAKGLFDRPNRGLLLIVLFNFRHSSEQTLEI